MNTIERIEHIIATIKSLQDEDGNLSEIERKVLAKELTDIALARDAERQKEKDFIKELGNLI
jgi:hypothetical protein